MISFQLNGQPVRLDDDIAPDTPLLWVLRDRLLLTGTKFGCGQGLCGACTVQMNGAPVRSCSLPVSTVADSQITTIEQLEHDKVGQVVQAVWQQMDVVQCGYCQSGQLMSATALLAGNPKPSDADIDNAMGGNICRCATYQRIRAAIHEAARRLA